MWVCLHWYLWAIQTKVWRQCSIWMEEKSQGKTLYIFFHRLCVHLKDTQIEVTTCAKVSRIEKYMDKLTLKITLRAMPKWYFTVQFSSVAQSCQTLCDPINRSTPGLPVHHELPEFTQTHAHQVSDAIQPSHPLLSPSLPAPNPSHH